MNYSLPSEIISNIFEYVSMTDLVRVERTCKLFQSFALCEIEKRIIRSSKDEWGILVCFLNPLLPYIYTNICMLP